MRIILATVLPVANAFVPVLLDQQQASLREPQEFAPAIGFHLTTSYGISAIRHENGTIEELARVKGNAGYIDQMAQWADFSTKKDCETLLETLCCSINDARRESNKSEGRPASEGVEMLATLLSELKTTVEGILKQQVHTIYPVLPVLPALDECDIRDALEYSGLEWLSPVGRSAYFETTAAYIGMGYGLCATYENEQACEQEQRAMKLEHVLFLNFDNSSLNAAFQPMQSVYRRKPNAFIVEPFLGWWDLPGDEIPRAKFWAEVQAVIIDILGHIPIIPGKIILLGDHCEDEEFQAVVKAALLEILDLDASALLEANNRVVKGESVAAMGAAEMAFRLQYSTNGQYGEKGSIAEGGQAIIGEELLEL